MKQLGPCSKILQEDKENISSSKESSTKDSSPKESGPGKKMTAKGIIQGLGLGVSNTSGASGGGAGQPPTTLARKILVLSQKGDWATCDQSLKALEREAQETGNRIPLATVADNVNSTNFVIVSGHAHPNEAPLFCCLIGDWQYTTDVCGNGK